MSEDLYVIAEAGNNHNGDSETAERLIDVAGAAGAQSVKFQLIYPEGLYVPKLWSEGGQLVDNPSIAARYAHKLADHQYRKLATYCARRGIAFSGSVFDVEGTDLLDSLDVDYFKIASCDLNNLAFVRAVAERGRRVVLSTGMSTLEEVERTLEEIDKTGNRDIVLLHCVSIYPATTEQMNLGFIEELARLGFPVGLSDHTPDSRAAMIAIGLGARFFEKHFTLDRTQEGFDHAYALEPEQLEQFIGDLEAGMGALTPALSKVGEQEERVASVARRAIYAARAISPGESLSEGDVLVVRPAGPIPPTELSQVIGATVRTAIDQYQPLEWDLLER